VDGRPGRSGYRSSRGMQMEHPSFPYVVPSGQYWGLPHDNSQAKSSVILLDWIELELDY